MDARSIVEQVYSAWDGEVDVVVILIPKDGARQGTAARTLTSTDLYRAVLEDQLRRATDQTEIPPPRGRA